MENNIEKLESFFDYCKNYIIDHIENWEGSTKYACNLGDYLTEGRTATAASPTPAIKQRNI